jgi:hypothetical protein
MVGDVFSEYMATSIIPSPAFAGRTEGVLIEAGAIFAAGPGISLGQVSSNGSHGPIELVCEAGHSFVEGKSADIMPTQLGQEQCQAVGFDFPQNVVSYFCGNRF